MLYPQVSWGALGQWLARCDKLEKAEPARLTQEASGDPGRWPVCNLPAAGADTSRKQGAVCKTSAAEWDEGVLGTRGAEDKDQQQEGRAAEGHRNQPRQATWRMVSGPGPRVKLVLG